MAETTVQEREVTIAEAAELEGISRQRIHKMIKEGKLGGCRQSGNVWLVTYPLQRIGTAQGSQEDEGAE